MHSVVVQVVDANVTMEIVAAIAAVATVVHQVVATVVTTARLAVTCELQIVSVS